MADEQWQRLWEVFHRAAELPVGERVGYLDAACGGDAELRREVEELLVSQGESGVLDAGRPTYATDVASARGLSERLLGQRIGPYRLLEEIGEGGVGVVYLAEQEQPVRRRVALKLIKLGMDTREVVARFETERQALAMMDHPGIARVLDAGATDEGRPYFVMEHVAGVHLHTYCDRHRLDLRQRLELFRSVCQAVQHAHQKGIVHRDLKPSNVLVALQDGQPVAKVIDFGIAKAIHQRLTEKTLHTELGRFIGTPEYMSPEQAERSELDVDTRTDIYSLGVLLYQLLVGCLPFESERLRQGDYLDVVRVLQREEPPRPSAQLARQPAAAVTALEESRRTTSGALRRALGDGLDWIVMKAMEKDRTRRYDSASELAADVDRYLADQPVAAGPPSTAYRLRKFLARHRRSVVLGAAALLLLVAFSVTTALQSRRVRRALAEAEGQRQRSETVSRFLVDLFEVSDPESGRGAAVTAREILDQGAARVDRELAAEPRLRSAMMEVIGRVYQQLGLYDRALELQAPALEERQRHPEWSSKERAESLDGLGRTRFLRGEYDEAIALLEEAVELRRSALGERAPAVAESLHHLGWVYHDLGDYDRAGELYRESLELRRAALGDGHRDVAASLHGLATLEIDQGDYEAAARHARQALETRRRLFGEEHPAVAASLDTLGLALHRSGDLVAAEPLYRRALEIRERLLGAEHPVVATSLTSLGLLLKAHGEPQAAEPLLRRALDIYRASLGEEHSYVATAENNLAGALVAAGDDAGAETLYRSALARTRRTMGDRHPLLAAGLHNLGGVLERRGALAEAERCYREALELDRAALGDDHPYVGDDWQSLGALLAARGMASEAGEALQRAVELRRGGPAMALAASLESLGRLRCAGERPVQAEPLLRQALDLVERQEPVDVPRRARVQSALGDCLSRQGRFAEAEPLLAMGLETLTAERGGEHPDSRRARQAWAAHRERRGDQESGGDQ